MVAALPTVDLDRLLDDARIFRAGRTLRRVVDDSERVRSGLPELDALLPWGGFPRGCLSEILIAHDGVGELSLLLPALCEIARQQPIAFVAPPYLPYAPALVASGLPLSRLLWVRSAREQTPWAAEQCLRAGCLGAVLVWSDSGDDHALRRLQMAAENSAALAFVLRPARHADNPSPAALRLEIESRVGSCHLRVRKCRGAIAPAQPIPLPRRH